MCNTCFRIPARMRGLEASPVGASLCLIPGMLLVSVHFWGDRELIRHLVAKDEEAREHQPPIFLIPLHSMPYQLSIPPAIRHPRLENNIRKGPGWIAITVQALSFRHRSIQRGCSEPAVEVGKDDLQSTAERWHNPPIFPWRDESGRFCTCVPDANVRAIMMVTHGHVSEQNFSNCKLFNVTGKLPTMQRGCI